MPRRLLRDGLIVEDEWQYHAQTGDQPVGALILTLDQWLVDRDAWIAGLERPGAGRIGVLIAPSHRPEALAHDLAHLSLVAVEFSGPADGRGYSQGRLLRERWKFLGELRATGYVRRDQLFFLARCGFDSFEMPDTELDHLDGGFADFSAAYQLSNDAGLPVRLHHR